MEFPETLIVSGKSKLMYYGILDTLLPPAFHFSYSIDIIFFPQIILTAALGLAGAKQQKKSLVWHQIYNSS